MVWSLVQKNTAQGTGGSSSLPGASTAGNLLVAIPGSGSSTPFSNSQGWTAGPVITNGTVSEVQIWFYPANPGGISSVTFTGPAGAIFVDIAEFTCNNGALVSGTSDTGTKTGGSSTSLTVTSAGSSKPGDLIICGFLEHVTTAAVCTWTDPGGFLNFGETVSSGNNHSYGGYNLSASAGGVQSVTGTNSLTASGTGWTGVVATFTEPVVATAAYARGGISGVREIFRISTRT